MGMMLKFLLPLLAVVISLLVYSTLTPPQPPALDLDAWWGPEGQDSDTSIRPYRIQFSDAMRDDLQKRLLNTRLPPPELEGTQLEYGFGKTSLEPIINHWLYKYRFQEREKFLNSFPQYKTKVQGLDVHFIWVRPEVPQTSNKEVLPMLILHGWPGSVREFYDVIPLLTAVQEDRDFVLELVVPSLPGFGFSDPAVRPGLGAPEVGVMMRNLMRRLGHKKFYIQGGDWGSIIGGHMSVMFPDEILGFHTNMAFVNTPVTNLLTVVGSIYPPLVVDQHLQDRMYPMGKKFSELLRETGYLHLQATKPDTIGSAISQSPAGLAAYILEKFQTAAGPGHVFNTDALIDNLMFYWTSNSATTSFRLYAESFNKRQMDLGWDGIPIQVPTWIIQAKMDTYQSPTLLKYKYPNTLNFTVLENGGHFLAMELPEEFAVDVLNAVKGFRRYWKRMNESSL